MSDLIGARLAQQAAVAGGELTLSLDDQQHEQISANSGLIASFSSRGPAPYSLALKPDVAAPGVDIVSPIPGGYGTWSGTSMATPAVAGAAALLHQRHPSWTPAEIKSALVLTARPVFNDTAHKHLTSVLAAGGGMIDVQAADSPGLFAAPSGISFGLLRPGKSVEGTVELSDAGNGGGTWTIDAKGLEGPATVELPEGGKQTCRSRLLRLPAPRSATAPATSSSPPGRTPCTSAGGAMSSDPTSRRCTRGTSRPARWIKGDTREGTRLVKLYRWPAGPAGSGLPRAYPGREELWSFIVPPGARNAGIEGDGLRRAADPPGHVTRTASAEEPALPE